MTKKRKTGPAIGAAAAFIAVLCTAGVCNGVTKEEKTVRRVTVTAVASTSQTTEPVSSTTQPTSTVPVTATAESIAVTAAPPQIATAVTCSATEQELGETPSPASTEQNIEADTTVQLTATSAPVTTTAPVSTEPYNGQTSGDYIYVNGFGWIFNEGGGGEGSVNYEMYCNGNKIGYFG